MLCDRVRKIKQYSQSPGGWIKSSEVDAQRGRGRLNRGSCSGTAEDRVLLSPRIRAALREYAPPKTLVGGRPRLRGRTYLFLFDG